jgi:trans-aconitate 2-methyltransferase
MRYTFGTDKMAAGRLEKMAEVFNPYSASFIKKHAKYPVGSAVDLGCGPGFSTHMLFMSVQAKQVYGFDNSEDYICEAINRFNHCIFVRHDLSFTPFLFKPDIMYARFVLSHLPNPVKFVNMWANELKLNGMIFIEELEAIETNIDVFKKYLTVNEGLIASQGANLYVGSELSKGDYDADILVNESFKFPVRNHDAAAMFYPNTINIWEREGYVLNRLSFNERKEVSAKILEIMGSNDESFGITWTMRRMVLKNSGYGRYLELFI